MATKLHGRINLSAIPKSLITKDNKGNSVIWVDILTNRQADNYGNTHSIVLYNKETKEKIYLGNFAPQEFGSNAAPAQAAPAPAPAQAAASGDDDLPF